MHSFSILLPWSPLTSWSRLALKMKPLILFACFLPIGVIYIVMKLAVWVSVVNAENNYVRKEPLRKRGPYVENPYADVDADDEEYGDRTDYR